MIGLRAVRAIAGITIDELIGRIEEETGVKYTRGAISAVENGHRGASPELIQGLALAYGIAATDITTDYEPRTRTAA